MYVDQLQAFIDELCDAQESGVLMNGTDALLADLKSKNLPNLLELAPYLYIMNQQNYDNGDGTVSRFLMPMLHGMKDFGKDSTMKVVRDPATERIMLYDNPGHFLGGMMGGGGDMMGGLSWLLETGNTASIFGGNGKGGSLLEELGLMAILPQVLELVRPRNFRWNTHMKSSYNNFGRSIRGKSPAVGTCWGSCECNYSHADLKEMMRELNVPGRSKLTRKDQMCAVIDWLKPYGVHIRNPFAGWSSMMHMNGFDEEIALPLILYEIQSRIKQHQRPNALVTILRSMAQAVDKSQMNTQPPQPTSGTQAAKAVQKAVQSGAVQTPSGAAKVVEKNQPAAVPVNEEEAEEPPKTPSAAHRTPKGPGPSFIPEDSDNLLSALNRRSSLTTTPLITSTGSFPQPDREISPQGSPPLLDNLISPSSKSLPSGVEYHLEPAPIPIGDNKTEPPDGVDDIAYLEAATLVIEMNNKPDEVLTLYNKADPSIQQYIFPKPGSAFGRRRRRRRRRY